MREKRLLSITTGGMCEIKIAKPVKRHFSILEERLASGIAQLRRDSPVPPPCDFTHFKPPLSGRTLHAQTEVAMFQTTQTFHPVPTIFDTGFVASSFEDDAHPKLPADREWLFNDFVNTLHALVWGAEI